GAEVPALADALLRRHGHDELADLLVETRPRQPQVAVEREGLVLRQDVHAAQAAVDAVAQGEVNDAIAAAERDRRLGAVARERVQALALPAAEDDDQSFSRHGLLLTLRPAKAG